MLYEDIDLLTTNELLSLPPVKWLMEPLIPQEGFVGLCGQPGDGKSFIALDWAMCIAEGRPWLGVYPTVQCPVVYVAAEGGRGIQQRVRAWMKHYGYQNLPAMYFLLSPLYIREEGTVEAFLDKLDDEQIWPGLIVLDTLSRSFGGGEENASADMGHFVDMMTKLAQGRRMAALVVHHMNALGTRERGSTAFRGATDAMFMCKATKDKESGRILNIELKNDKQKDAAENPSIWLKPMEDVNKSLIFEASDPPEKLARGPKLPAPMRVQDMVAVLAVAENGLTWNEWRIATGITKDAFNMRVRKLTMDSIIVKENGRYYLIPTNKDIANVD
jgi:AAA domain-containing protein